MTSEKNRKSANIYIEQTDNDFALGRKFMKKKDFNKSALLLNQSAINALSAICVLNGRHQNPSYNCSEMLLVALRFEPNLEELREACLEMDKIQENTFFDLRKQKVNPVNAKDLESFKLNAEIIIRKCKHLLSL